jgi:hypothetical protein
MTPNFGWPIGGVNPDFHCALSNGLIDPVIDQALMAHRP